MASITGTISRANLATPLDDLDIFNDIYKGLFGDDSQAADSASDTGIDPGLSQMKYTWADSPFVAGQQLVNFVPDLTTMYLRFLVKGSDQEDAQANLAAIIQACILQPSYQVSITIDGIATYTWNCYPAEYQVVFNQWAWFGPLPPLYLAIPRDPIPVSGPI
jgi:hypothetical protein